MREDDIRRLIYSPNRELTIRGMIDRQERLIASLIAVITRAEHEYQLLTDGDHGLIAEFKEFRDATELLKELNALPPRPT